MTTAGLLAVPLSPAKHSSFVWVFALFLLLLVVLAVFVIRFALKLGREQRQIASAKTKAALAGRPNSRTKSPGGASPRRQSAPGTDGPGKRRRPSP